MIALSAVQSKQFLDVLNIYHGWENPLRQNNLCIKKQRNGYMSDKITQKYKIQNSRHFHNS